MVLDYYRSLPYFTEYISDEVWYVSSARNLLYEMGIKVESKTLGGATVVVEDNADIDRVIGEIERRGLGEVIISNYTEIKAIYIKPYSIEKIDELASIEGVEKVVPGYYYEDRSNIYNYLNLEHPPLGKYLIGLSMLLLGDDPQSWRVPSIVAGAVVMIIVFLVVYEITRSHIFSLLAPLLLLSDSLFRYMSGIAMLDIFLALFTVASIYFIVREKLDLASIFIGLAASVKLNGAFILLPYLLLLIARGDDYLTIYRRAIVVPLAVFMAVNAPVIAVVGFEKWYDESVVGAIQWHISTKTKPGEGPPISTPWEWFYGANPFYFTVDPDTPAVGNIYAYISTIASSAAIVIALRRNLKILDLTLLTYTTWVMYVVLWLIGNRSQYSFYMLHITPMMHILLTVNLWFASIYYREIIEDYRSIVRKIIYRQKQEEQIQNTEQEDSDSDQVS